MHLPLTELERMWICGVCAGLNGIPGPRGSGPDERVQRCSCRRIEEPRWPGFDIQEHVHLCECCLQEALRSGSKFSIWFCRQCHDLVTALNDELRVWLIPIGRHSFMVKTYRPPGYLMLQAVLATSPDKERYETELKRFATGMFGMFSSIEQLQEWSRATLLQNLRELRFPPGTGVPLTEYLQAVRARAAEDEHFSREDAFRRLEAHMLAGRVPAPPEDA